MITILGGGIAGAALARALAVRGRGDVVVFDPLCWLHVISIRKNSSLPEWYPSLVALALLKRGKCRAIERGHECLMYPLSSGHLQAEGDLISHLKSLFLERTL